MRSRSDIYRANAEACRYQATLPQNAAEKDRLFKLADEWTKLAEEAKKDRARLRGTTLASSAIHVSRLASTGS
jgi:hypothetical protein